MTATMPPRPAASPARPAPRNGPDARPGRAGQAHGGQRPVAPGGRRSQVIIVAAVLLAVAAETPLLRVFGLPGIRLLVLAAPVSALTAAATRRLSPVAGFLAGLLTGTVPGMLLAPADPFGSGNLAGRLEQAVTDGWYRLLSVPVPVPFTRSFTDLPYLVAAAVAALIMLLALSDHPTSALGPATLTFGGLLVLGVSGPVAGTILAGGYAVSVLLFMAAAAASVPGRVAVAGVAAGTAVIVTSALVAGALHVGKPYNPRATLQPPVNVTVSQDPMVLIPARLETPGTPVLTARLSGGLLADPRNWVLLTYDDYDGEGWQAPGDARPAITAGKAPGASQAGTAVVTADTAGSMLPHPPLVTGTFPAEISYAPDSELLAAPTAVSEYTVHAWVSDPGQATLASAPAQSGVAATLTAVPDCARALLAPLAGQLQSAAGLPGVQAALLAKRLSSAPYSYAPKAPPGEGCASVGTLFTGAHKGTSAQFATAFALTARMLGIPARVAVGYLPGRVVDGVDFVTDGDAYAWAQVDLAGVGWVDFDPTPAATSVKNPPVHEKQAGVTNLENTKPPKQGPSGPVAATPGSRPRPGLSTAVKALLAAGGAIIVILAWVAAVWLLGARRRERRRRAPSPADQVLGAWDELLLPLRQAGMSVRGLAAPGVASAAAAILPASEARAVAELAELAERAIYARTVDPREAGLAWQLSDQLRRPALAAAGRRTRIRRTFLPARR